LSFIINLNEINYIISDLLIAIIIGCFVEVCKKNQTKYFSSFWVESVPIFWLLIVMLINYFLESFITLSFISDL
jgi:small-conductance mechanosensitive channel